MRTLCSPSQQARRFLNTDFLGIQAIEDCATINAALTFGRAAQRSYNFIQATASGVVGNIQVARHPLNIAPVLHQQFDKIELFAREPANPAQAKAPLDHNTAFRTLQAGDNQLTAAHRISRNEWMHPSNSSLNKRIYRSLKCDPLSSNRAWQGQGHGTRKGCHYHDTNASPCQGVPWE